MPRLDNSDARNLSVLREWGGRSWANIQFNPDDPGDMPPMDVCRHCHYEYCRHDDGLVAHPLYDGEGYHCAICMNELTEEDDNPY